MTKEELETALRDFFGDTSRPPEETKDALEDLELLCAELAATIDVDE